MNINWWSNKNKMKIKAGRWQLKHLAQHPWHKVGSQQMFCPCEHPSNVWGQLSYVYFLLNISANLMSSLHDLISRLSAKAPSVKNPTPDIIEPAHRISRRTCLLIHLLIHSLSKHWLKAYYIGHLASAYPPLTNGFQVSLGNICLPSFSVPGLWGEQTLPQLLLGLAFDPRWPIRASHSPGHHYGLGTGMLPRENQSETLKKKSLFPEISAELLERGIIFSLLLELLTYFATTIQKEIRGSAERWGKPV